MFIISIVTTNIVTVATDYYHSSNNLRLSSYIILITFGLIPKINNTIYSDAKATEILILLSYW